MKHCGIPIIALLSISLFRCGGDGGGMMMLPSGSGGSATIPIQAVSLSLDTDDMKMASGATHEFSVTVPGYTGALSYQWFVDDVLQAGNGATFSFTQDTTDTKEYKISVRAYASDAEGWADVNATVYGSDPDTANVVDLGSIIGDCGADMITYSGKGDVLLRVYTKETLYYYNSVWSTKQAIKTKLVLDPGSEADYDMVVFSDKDFTKSLALKETRGNDDESIGIAIADDFACIYDYYGLCMGASPDETDQGRHYYIWVKCHEDTGGEDWTLTVSGNTE